MFFMTSKLGLNFYVPVNRRSTLVQQCMCMCFLFFLFEGIMLNSRKIQDIDFLTMVPRHSLGQMHSL